MEWKRYVATRFGTNADDAEASARAENQFVWWSKENTPMVRMGGPRLLYEH